jgi:hypothetical protein
MINDSFMGGGGAAPFPKSPYCMTTLWRSSVTFERESVSQFEIRNCILRCYTPPVIQVRISSRATPSPTRGLFKVERACGGRLYSRLLLDTKERHLKVLREVPGFM